MSITVTFNETTRTFAVKQGNTLLVEAPFAFVNRGRESFNPIIDEQLQQAFEEEYNGTDASKLSIVKINEMNDEVYHGLGVYDHDIAVA